MEGSGPSLGPYALIGKLGQGQSGQVRLAINVETKQKVAIKIINKEIFASKPNLQVKVQREIALMHLADHPHLLKLIDVLESPRHLYIVVEYAAKGELFNFLVEHKSLDESMAMKFFRQIIYGLEYLHSLGICHRDLKLENILLDENLNIKIADFGFARFVKYNIAETSCGSPHYAAPEVIGGHPYDGRMADVWSCGVILYALLAGYLPFDDKTIRGLLTKVKRGVYQMPNFSEPAKNFISRILVLDPTKRLTIPAMKMHPFFRINLPSEYVIPTPLPIPSLLEPIDPSTVTAEVLDVLHKIGYTNDQELFTDITSNQHSMAKVFYYMLTAKLSLEQIDWSKSMSNTFNPQIGNDDVYAFDGMNSYSGLYNDSFQGSVQSADLSTSVAHRVEWAFTEEPRLTEDIQKFNIIANMSRVYALLAMQRLMRQLEMQWFHSDDFVILARREQTYILISCLDMIDEEKVTIQIQLLNGPSEFFSHICHCADEIINQMNMSYWYCN
ncbi:CAMK family protein kinase [Histomonas meleagridis]|uniref:CAMK family protein kinase n=1 Tax=Histomonas meleagridis TaxID=135588 RepID=UPI003559E74D|nr:CAMK family protein kinase [Histomonas meleagridis]KAH0797815.1 CAMK family protein kinase [Histomonas meleagridis]